LQFCTKQDVAGGTTVETTNGISGILTFDDDKIVGARVLLIPNNGLALGDEGDYFEAVSDKNGKFIFPNLNGENYQILVRYQDSLAVLSDANCNLNCTLKLEKTGVIQVSLATMPLGIGDTIGLIGTDLVAVVDSNLLTSHELVFSYVPNGIFENWIVLKAQAYGQPASKPVYFQSDVLKVSSGDSSSGNVALIWPYQVRAKLKIVTENSPQIENDGSGFHKIRIPLDESFYQLLDVLDANGLLRDGITDLIPRDFLNSICIRNPQGQALPFEVLVPDAMDQNYEWSDYSADLSDFGWDKAGDFSYLWIGLDSTSLDSVLIQYNTRDCNTDDNMWNGWLGHWHLKNKEFTSLDDRIADATNWTLPEAVSMVAMVKPNSGMMGGEIVSMGNHVGMRMDHLDSMIAVYAYSSYEGVSNWHVLAGWLPIDSLNTREGWVLVHLLVDPAQGVFSLYFNGELASQYTSEDPLYPITYDKTGSFWTIGSHSLSNSGLFEGLIDEVLVYDGLLSESEIAWHRRVLLEGDQFLSN
jgi:hypothetical protein